MDVRRIQWEIQSQCALVRFPGGQTLFYSVAFRTTDFKVEEIAFRIDITH